MKVKTADLIGPALDWAVAQCKGFKKIRAMPAWSNKYGAYGGPQVMVSNEEDSSFDYRPSTIWSQGGPIIEQEAIGIGCLGKSAIYANPWLAARTEDNTEYAGPTPLIAACRCFAARLGDEVDVPDELV